MPSFDIVSKIDNHELTNAVDQAKRELERRFDFKGVDATFGQEENAVILSAPSEFQVEQMLAILRARLVARGIDLNAADEGEIEANLSTARQTVAMKQGIDKPAAKKIMAQIKDAKLKVTAQIMDDKLRVTGKKRDDLQTAIALLKKEKQDQPLQFENFRD